MDIEAAGRGSGLDDLDAPTPSELVAPIYAATFSRAVVGGLDWQKTDPTAVLLAEPDAQFKRREAAGDVVHWISLNILRSPN